MTVFTGECGYVELRRTNGTERPGVNTQYVGSDVSLDMRRFSVDGNGPNVGNFLITGDRVRIKLSDPMYKSDVQFLDNAWLVKDHTDSDGKYYTDWTGHVHIDSMGGIRLFTSYAEALEGKVDNALELEFNKPPQSERFTGVGTLVLIEQINVSYRCLSQVQQFDFTTERETVDCTRLGDAFRKQYDAGLITGQGTLNCIWNYKHERCIDNPTAEFSHYLSQLCIRIHTGAMFTGRFVLHSQADQSVFYEAACVVTNASIEVAPSQLIESSIQFVTTDVIQLRVGQVPGAVLQEDLDLVLEEDDSPLYLDE